MTLFGSGANSASWDFGAGSVVDFVSLVRCILRRRTNFAPEPGGEPPRPVSCTGRWDGAAVSVEARIIAFLSRRRGQLFCDDCLRRELQLTQHAAVERATKSVGAAVGVAGQRKHVRGAAGSRLGPNPADPHRNDRPTGNAGPARLSRKRPDCGDTLTFHTAPHAAG